MRSLQSRASHPRYATRLNPDANSAALDTPSSTLITMARAIELSSDGENFDLDDVSGSESEDYDPGVKKVRPGLC